MVAVAAFELRICDSNSMVLQGPLVELFVSVLQVVDEAVEK